MENDVVTANNGISPYPLYVDQSLLDSVYFGWDYYNWSQQSEIKKEITELFFSLMNYLKLLRRVWICSTPTIFLLFAFFCQYNLYYRTALALEFYRTRKKFY